MKIKGIIDTLENYNQPSNRISKREYEYLQEQEDKSMKDKKTGIKVVAGLGIIGTLFFWNKSNKKEQEKQQLKQEKQQLETSNKQLETSNKQLETSNKQLETLNKQLETSNKQLETSNKNKKIVIKELREEEKKGE